MRRFAAAFIGFVASAGSVSAQVVVRGAGADGPPTPNTIMEAIKQADPFKHGAARFGESRRLDSLRCRSTFVLPDSMALISDTDGHAVTFTAYAERFPGFGTWGDERPTLSQQDTLRARVIGATCEPEQGAGEEPTVYVERDGYVIGIDPSSFVRATEPGARLGPGVAMIIGPHGALDTALVRPGCVAAAGAGTCNSIVSIRPFRDSVARSRATDKAELDSAVAAVDRKDRAARLRAARAQGWSKTVVSAIADERVTIGMSAAMVRLAWGEPDHVNTTVTRYGRHEQWVYRGGAYVYFRNGRVDAIQE